jgi:hypothetical protein
MLETQSFNYKIACYFFSLEKSLPPEIIESPQRVGHLLNLYNHHWRDSRFRNCINNVQEQYSKIQQDYFSQKPGPQRIEYLSKLLSEV